MQHHRLSAKDPPITCLMWDSYPRHSPPPNPEALSSQMGPLVYPIKLERLARYRSRVGSRLALIPLVIGSILSPQKVNLMGCATPPLISQGPSHHLSYVGLLSVTLSIVCGANCSKLNPKLQRDRISWTQYLKHQLCAHSCFKLE